LLYVCNRFNNDVSVVDIAAARELARIQVTREPADAALSPDGKLLLVANALPAGRADAGNIAAEVSVISTARRAVIGRIRLPNGCTSVRAIRIAPDGALAAVTHVLGRYNVPTTQIDRGWVQTNALSILDVPGGKRLATVLLDEIDSGAANPWAVEWTADGRRLGVTHAGTHELSVIDVAGLRAKLAAGQRDPADDLSFLLGLRRRIKLAGNGPRALAFAGSRAYVAGYFSDTVETIDLDAASPAAETVVQLSQTPLTKARQGEMLFNDGTLSFQGWLSCVSCHSPDARVDGLNWDLLNDGIGNPKNAKSLLLAHRTPPAMSEGVRDRAETAVRAGIRHILFAEGTEAEAEAIDEFLQSLQPVSSPYRASRRGRRLFFDRKVGCASCHPPGLFTDLKSYDVGTGGKFDTPTLVETWRTAPYLHDGSAATMRELLHKHGQTTHLTGREIDDLAAYLLSL
jgi:YVTN family beta-propeller protein